MSEPNQLEDDVSLGRPHYPVVGDISPSEFETFVVELFRAAGPTVEGLEVKLHEKVEATDGTYDFDGTARFRWNGMDFLVLIEAKRHKHPIDREYVQVLYQKVQSVGAHKGVIVSTAHFKSGALEFAKAHGIALVEITDGRFTFLRHSADPMPPISREQARSMDIPALVGHCYGPGEETGSTSITLIAPEYPDHVAEVLLGVDDVRS